MSAEILHFFGVLDAPNRIRELRLGLGLSQQALADRIGVSKVTISDLELGKMKLDTGYMRRLANALDVQPADLLPLSDNPDALTPDERRLIEQFREATEDQREQLRRVADVITPWHGKAEQGRKAG